MASHLDRTAGAEPDESRLVAAAKGGDTLAYAQLLRRHQAVAFRAASLIAGSAAEAEDATQEACVKAWLARHGLAPHPPLLPDRRSSAGTQRRPAGRRAGLALRVGHDPARSLAAPSAEAETLAGEERARLAAAVGELGEDDQLVIAARYFIGLSEAETATALGLRRGTVKSRLSRALGRLRTKLEVMG